MFEWMTVDSSYCYWRGPLVVLFMDVFIKIFTMQQPTTKESVLFITKQQFKVSSYL